MSEEQVTAERAIDLPAALAIVAGSMLGIGIFLSPPIVASNTAGALGFYGLWFLGGLISLAGAVACAELGAMIPKAGGDYTFQREAFGPSIAFASGWVLFAAIFSGSIATMTVGLATYQLPVLFGVDFGAELFSLPLFGSMNGARLAAIAIILVLTAINLQGAQPSARTQIVLTVVPIAFLAGLSLYALALTPAAAPDPAAAIPETSISTFVVGYMAVYFAYSGWINIIYVAGEVKDPGRIIPASLLGGTVLVTLLYLLLCAGFVHVLGSVGLRDAGEAGSAVAASLGGDAGRYAVTVLIACALVASINATVLGGARVAYAMAQDGAMWPLLGRLQERALVPDRALWLQAAISILLVLTGTFELLYTMVGLAMVVTGTLTVASLFRLRADQPERERPYRATAYPVFPALYIISSLFVLFVMVGEAFSGEPGAWYPLIGLGVLVAAYGFHKAVSSGS